MKIGILTLVPYDNYGGILQGYALQTILQRMGHEVSILHTKPYNYRPFNTILKDTIKWYIKKYVLRRKNIPCINVYKYLDYRIQNIQPFLDKWINFTRDFQDTKDIYKYITKNGYNGFVVGSDQTWRPCLSPDLYHMFLDFLPKEDKKKRVAYAASFGVDNNEFLKHQIDICRPLLQRFNAVSVREKSGVNLCKMLFNVEAKNVLDPTMLLDKEDYLYLIEKYQPINPDIKIMQYVFFFNNDKYNIINKVSQELGNKPVNLMTKRFLHEVYKKKQINEAVFYPVEEFLYAYSHSEFVVTDSFHGTVFCIIFNVSFIVVSPVAITRFKSLLSIFGLQNRLIMNAYEVTEELMREKIDWNSVNKIRNNLKKKSLSFLYNAL